MLIQKIFTLKMLQHRSQSRILTLKDGNGIWMSGEALSLHISDAFKMLFTSTSSHNRSKALLGQQHSQNSPLLEHYQWLSSIPQPKEISRNILSLPPLKGPGLDGYHAIFFKRNWHIIDPSVIQVI